VPAAPPLRLPAWGAAFLAFALGACAPAGLTPSPGAASPSVIALPSATQAPTPGLPSPPAAAGAAILVGAGDIGECGTGGPAATADAIRRVLDDHPDAVVFTVGDDAYPDGTAADFARCYDPWWGAFLDRTRPAAGNHEWHTPGAAGYRAYFGNRAGPDSRTWYAYDAGSWRVIVLDSDCDQVGGCDPSSPQGTWLAGELAAHPAACTLAVWHHPRFSSGPHGDQDAAVPLFDTLYAAGADVVVNGHDHDYERFAPQDPAGRADPVRGIREFVVGTGGAHRYITLFARDTSEVRNSNTFGVLVLELAEGSYSWRFEPAGDSTFTDSGTGTCH
jgi:acid phosphatase type 7